MISAGLRCTAQCAVCFQRKDVDLLVIAGRKGMDFCLWNRRGGDSSFRSLRGRFYCLPCQRSLRRRIRPIEISTTHEWHTVALPMPDIREWKRALKRVRT